MTSGSGSAAFTEEMVTMLPPAPAVSSGSASRVTCTAARKLTDSVASQSCAVTEAKPPHQLFDSCGAVPFADRARAELLATGGQIRKRTLPPPKEDLTPQERHVALLAADGNTNAEIASRLFITVSTVEFHLSKVFRKLGISSRRQLKTQLAAERAGSYAARAGR